MSIKLGPYLFTGPFPIDTTEIRANHVPAVYAIIAKGGQAWAPSFRVVDLGASPDQGIRFAAHPRRAEWRLDAGESLAVYLFEAPSADYSALDRARVIGDLYRIYAPPHGRVSLG